MLLLKYGEGKFLWITLYSEEKMQKKMSPAHAEDILYN